MIGSIIGDIVGSTREFKPIKKTEFMWLPKLSGITDDTILTIATADALLNGLDFAKTYKYWGHQYPNPKGAYGVRFKEWLLSESDEPYGSYGNGAPMRVGPIGWLKADLETCLELAKKSAECTHNHEEGIKAAKAVTEVIWLCRNGLPKETAIQNVALKYDYVIDKTLAEMRPDYRFDETSQGTVPVALRCVLEATNFEQAIRLAISMGGDADTLAAITGSMAEVCFPADYACMCEAISYLPFDLSDCLFRFYEDQNFGFDLVYDLALVQWIKSYKKAIYEILWNDKVEVVMLDSKLRINKTTIGLITAANPNSNILTEDENQERNAELKQVLDEMKCTYVGSNGKDVSGSWPEEKGFAVLGLTKDQLIQLAKQFGQNAIVYLEDGKPSELVWCR